VFQCQNRRAALQGKTWQWRYRLLCLSRGLNGKLYYTSENGDVYVIKPGAEFELLAENSMNDICMATPAVSENTIFFRTHHYLIAISDDGR